MPCILLYVFQVYRTRKLGCHLAVDKLCIGVPAGEVCLFGSVSYDNALYGYLCCKHRKIQTDNFKIQTRAMPSIGSNEIANSVGPDLKEQHSLIRVCMVYPDLFVLKLYSFLVCFEIRDWSYILM